MGVDCHTDETKAKMRAAWVQRRTRLPSVWDHIEVGDCWLWKGTPAGRYGQVGERGRHRLAHRVIYELLVGPIPVGLTLDHLCRNPPCVNPDHLEPVTVAENIRRGFSPSARNAAKVVCKAGHPFDERSAKGSRACSVCRRAKWRRWDARRRAAA